MVKSCSPDTISPSDPHVIIAGIRQFGLASDGSDLRDLENVIACLQPATPTATGGDAVAGEAAMLAEAVIISYFDSHGINDARAGAFNILDRLREAGLTVSPLRSPDAAARATVSIDVSTALATFLQWAMQEGPWLGGDLDGAATQDKAEALGLIVEVTYDPVVHGENEFDVCKGEPWFVLSPAVKQLFDGVAQTEINPVPSAFDIAVMEERDRLRERLTDVVTMLDTPDAYNREYIAAVCRSILSSVSSTEGK